MARHTVKLLLLDGEDRVLLIQGEDPAEGARHWYPVGGGLEEGEALVAAAAREAWEETGLERLPEATHVWTRDVTYEYAGRRVDVHEDWLLCRGEHFDPAPASLSEFEKQTTRQFRWWRAVELAATTDSVYPPDLGARLARLLEVGPPAAPENIGA